MNLPDTSGGQPAVDGAKPDRYEGIVSTVPIEETVEATPEVPEAKVNAEVSDKDEGDKADLPKKGGFTRKLERKDAEIAQIRAELAEIRNANKPKEEPKKEGKPVYESFESNEAYFEALAEWKLDEKDKERKKTTEEESLRKQFADKQTKHNELASEFKKTHPDFDEVIDDYEGPPIPNISQALLESDNGPKLAYHIAQDPELGEKLSKLGYVSLIRELGKIEAKLEVSEEAVEKPVVKATNAPAPIKPVGKSTKTSEVNPYDSPTDPDAYAAWRAKQKR